MIPTKEQIDEILVQMQRQGWFWDSIDYEDEYAVLRFIISEWEKIKQVELAKQMIQIGKELSIELGMPEKLLFGAKNEKIRGK